MKALRYTKRLVAFDSTSHKSNRMISKYLEMKLTKHGFVVEKIKYKDSNGVSKVNLVAKKGSGHGGLAYFCHSDVVPAKKWFTEKFGAFEPTVGKERLYGRGSCDMKGSIGCMLAAAQEFSWDDLKQPLFFICTADEEVGFHGARAVVEESKTYREMVSHGTKAIIGEPTSLEVVHAHKGSYEIVAKSKGKAAHSSTREGLNANLAMIPFLAEMKAIHDETETGPEYKNSLFQPSTVSWNIGIKDDAQALNITAASSKCTVYLRPMPEVDLEPLFERVLKCGAEQGLKVRINKWGEPFYAEPDSEFIQQTLKLANRPKAKTVSYGTDGGMLTEIADKIVFGPGSIDQAHTHNEWISLEQLKLGTEMYAKMIRHWCCQ
ncbi:MAG: M20/M25/M40 family metallo-hydrolase [Mariniblastus sp.]|nr:M20/M25/M40 family metallo-hydrolase [Mariniblastus sp.]